MIFKKIFLSFIICFMSQVQCAQESQALLLHGKELFIKEHYQDAFNIYQRISDKNFVVLYNMALCCFRLNQKTQALLFCKRAEKQAQSYKELTLIEKLLEFNQEQEFQTKGWFKQLAIFCKKVILATPILYVQIIVLIGLIFLMLFWYMYWYKNRIVISILLMIVWLLFYYIWLFKLDFIERQQGVIVDKMTPVYAGPDASFYKKIDLDESQLVVLIDQQHEYYKIKLDKLVGWIDSRHIELV